MKTHIEILQDLMACSEAIEWAKDYDSLEQAWSECHRSDWMLWLDLKMDLFTDKERRLMACMFVRKTPIGDGRTVWELLTDERSRNAVIVAERYANGDATKEELEAAYAAAAAAAASASAAYAAYASAAAASAASASAASAAYAAYASAAYAAYASARSQQADIIREFGNPFNGNEVKR